MGFRSCIHDLGFMAAILTRGIESKGGYTSIIDESEVPIFKWSDVELLLANKNRFILVYPNMGNRQISDGWNKNHAWQPRGNAFTVKYKRTCHFYALSFCDFSQS